MKRFDIVEIGFAIRLGGKIGLVVLVPASILLTFHPLFGPYSFASDDAVARWVRLGLEIFLMGGWGSGAVSLVRQVIARSLGSSVGALVGAMTGVLVMHAMAVFFILISGDAPDVLWVFFGGALVCGGIAVTLDRRFVSGRR